MIPDDIVAVAIFVAWVLFVGVLALTAAPPTALRIRRDPRLTPISGAEVIQHVKARGYQGRALSKQTYEPRITRGES